MITINIIAALFLLSTFIIRGVECSKWDEVYPYDDSQDLSNHIIQDGCGPRLYVLKDERTMEGPNLKYKDRRLTCVDPEAKEYKEEKVWVSTRQYGEGETAYNKNLTIVRFGNGEDQDKINALKEKMNKLKLEQEAKIVKKITTSTTFEMSISKEAAGTYTWWLEGDKKVYVNYNQANRFRNNNIDRVISVKEEVKEIILQSDYSGKEEMDIKNIQYGSRYQSILTEKNTNGYFDLKKWFLDLNQQGANLSIKKYLKNNCICYKPKGKTAGKTSYLTFIVEENLESHKISLIVQDIGAVDHFVIDYESEDTKEVENIQVHLENEIKYEYEKPTGTEDLEFKKKQFTELFNLLKEYSTEIPKKI